MKRIVWTFGLIAGGILALTMAVTMPFHEEILHVDQPHR